MPVSKTNKFTLSKNNRIMEKDLTKSAPKGRILSADELKHILGGVGDSSTKCECNLKLSNGTWRVEEVSAKVTTEKKCRSACTEACKNFKETSAFDGKPLTCRSYRIHYTYSESGTL